MGDADGDLEIFSHISKWRRSLAMLMHSKNWRSAMQMAVGARKTARKPLNGIVRR
jgi:hypothetical protein